MVLARYAFDYFSSQIQLLLVLVYADHLNVLSFQLVQPPGEVIQDRLVVLHSQQPLGLIRVILQDIVVGIILIEQEQGLSILRAVIRVECLVSFLVDVHQVGIAHDALLVEDHVSKGNPCI